MPKIPSAHRNFKLKPSLDELTSLRAELDLSEAKEDLIGSLNEIIEGTLSATNLEDIYSLKIRAIKKVMSSHQKSRFNDRIFLEYAKHWIPDYPILYKNIRNRTAQLELSGHKCWTIYIDMLPAAIEIMPEHEAIFCLMLAELHDEKIAETIRARLKISD
ncbi:hypothetical protein [Haematobacter missouriensis]|jgi:hypothetical protein|uniref:hypothetical protein n=2 Tax=Haematobacter missouriensis TaxID=366616 RepID=UPI0012EBE09F|nr:hypothetical protein [Haematobacter missouriensis]